MQYLEDADKKVKKKSHNDYCFTRAILQMWRCHFWHVVTQIALTPAHLVEVQITYGYKVMFVAETEATLWFSYQLQSSHKVGVSLLNKLVYSGFFFSHSKKNLIGFSCIAHSNCFHCIHVLSVSKSCKLISLQNQMEMKVEICCTTYRGCRSKCKINK